MAVAFVYIHAINNCRFSIIGNISLNAPPLQLEVRARLRARLRRRLRRSTIPNFRRRRHRGRFSAVSVRRGNLMVRRVATLDSRVLRV